MRCEVCRTGLLWLILFHVLNVYGNFTKLPYNLKIATDCIGVSVTPDEHHLTLNCSSIEQIAVDYIKYGFKQNTSTQCYEDFESNGVGECCSTNNTDCFVYKNDIASDCTGKDNCDINTKQLESTSYPNCNSHLNVSSFIEISYYCVSSDVDSINLADSADQKTSKNVHLQSFMYPEPNFNISTSCSVETECGVSLTVTLIESNIQCPNGSARKDQNSTNFFLCNGATNHSLIRVLQYSNQHFLYFTLQEVGRLWMMLSATDSVSNVTVTCGSDAQHNATSICPNITSQGSSLSTTGSSTPVTGASTTETGASESVTEPSTPVTGSSTPVTGSSKPVTGSSVSASESFTTSTGSSESAPIAPSDSNCTGMISTNTTLDYITENIPPSNFVDASMVIGVVCGVIVLISVIVVCAIVIKKKGKQKVSENQCQENTKIQAWV